MKRFKDKVVMVTGSCGTIGSELVRQLVLTEAAHIICIDNNESELFFQIEYFRASEKVSCYIVDIRDREELSLRMKGVDIVLHAAALKHVGLCEDGPSQAIATNIHGTQNVIDAAKANLVERVIFTSSDKAVNPTNVMGTTKLMGERLITAASSNDPDCVTKFGSTRFGNVLGSRGSVVPLFKRQIESGGPLTLTDRAMTRFIMSLEEAVSLVLDSVWLAENGEVLVTKMPVARIEDIAQAMITELSDDGLVNIDEIGAKPGEKMYEELMNDEEVPRTREYGNFFVIIPSFADKNGTAYNYLRNCKIPDRSYNSSLEKSMDLEEVAKYLRDSSLMI